MDKRGQFFILAAVILSAIIVSLGAGKTYAHFSEDEGFYGDFEEVKRESNEILDYQVFVSDGASGDEIESFAESYVSALRDKNPEVNVLFVYWNSSDVKAKSFFGEGVAVEGGKLQNGDSESEIKFRIGSTDFTKDVDSHDLNSWDDVDVENEKIEVSVGGEEFDFEMNENKKLIVLMQKSEGDEIYVVAR